MSLSEEKQSTGVLVKRLDAEFDRSLLVRYTLRPLDPKRLSLYRRLRIKVGRKLRDWGLRPESQPWVAGMQANSGDYRTDNPLLVWAVDCGLEDLRKPCRALADMLRRSDKHYDVVLVTDIADFAFYSRLGWLIEFVPVLSVGQADYALEKQRYIAWRYRNARHVSILSEFDDANSIEAIFGV